MNVLNVLKLMDAGYCLYVHIFMKNIKSVKYYRTTTATPNFATERPGYFTLFVNNSICSAF